jgi:hypothetical protein
MSINSSSQRVTINVVSRTMSVETKCARRVRRQLGEGHLSKAGGVGERQSKTRETSRRILIGRRGTDDMDLKSTAGVDDWVFARLPCRSCH